MTWKTLITKARLTRTLSAVGLMGLGGMLTLGGTAMAERGWGDNKGQYVRQMVQDMDLSTEQSAELAAIRDDFKAAMKEHRADRLDGFDTLVDAVDDDQVDRKAINSLIDKRIDAFAAEVRTSAEDLMDFIDDLDPDQRQIMVERLRQGQEKLEAYKARRGR